VWSTERQILAKAGRWRADNVVASLSLRLSVPISRLNLKFESASALNLRNSRFFRADLKTRISALQGQVVGYSREVRGARFELFLLLAIQSFDKFQTSPCQPPRRILAISLGRSCPRWSPNFDTEFHEVKI